MTPQECRILVVDDSVAARDLVVTILAANGYHSIHAASSAEEGLTLLSENEDELGRTFDLIMMDVNMPGGIDGIEAVKRIRARYTLEDIHIIMVTVVDEKEKLVEAFQAGATDYITKPINQLELVARVSSILRLKAAMDERKRRQDDYLDLVCQVNTTNKKLEELNTNLEEKAYEELKELDKMKDAFISNVSHEFGTPLTSIVGYTSMLKSRLEQNIFPHLPKNNPDIDKDTKKILHSIEIVLSDAHWITEHISNILEITQMETNEMVWDHHKIALKEAVKNAIKKVEQQFQDKGILLQQHIPEHLPDMVGDPTRLHKLVKNLLSNALKFTPKGIVECSLSFKDDNFFIIVADTGIGIPKESHDNIFDKFRQCIDKASGKPKGAGLGLPICKKIVEHHNGEIWLQSEVGKGTTFFCKLPLNNGLAT